MMRVFIRYPDGSVSVQGRDDIIHAPAPATDLGCVSQEEAAPKARVMEVDELAKLVGLSPKTIYAAIKAGEIPGVLRVGRTLRLSRHKIEAWLAGEVRVPSSRRNPR